MIIYFLLIGFASLLVGIEFVADFHSGSLKEEILDNINGATQVQLDSEDVFAPIDRLRSKALLTIGIIMFVMVIVLTMFIKNITEPLQHMIRLSHKISCGDLRQTIDIKENNELSELGNMINEMSSNLQEIIMFSQQACDTSRKFVNFAERKLENGIPDQKGLKEMKNAVINFGSELEMLNEIIAHFSLYIVEKKGSDE
ncbi:MAG: HAMP domain-containing protein [Desulfobacteraceae bacterium]|nr:HAMP domain-containing protein [Desulfobacteraceae bacterium]